MDTYDCIIVGTGPAGLGAAFHLSANRSDLRLLLIDKERLSTGGLRHDCKMNFTYPVGFPADSWTREQAEHYLELVVQHLNPSFMNKTGLETYQRRAERLDVRLLDIRQYHLGTDGGLRLIKSLMTEIERRGIEVSLGETVVGAEPADRRIVTNRRDIGYGNLILAPGRGGFRFLQTAMKKAGVHYQDNIVDIGIRIETREERYPIIRDYYDPKFYFPGLVRTFCTNSGSAYVVKERYETREGRHYYSVNGHAYSNSRKKNGLVNFALLKTVTLTAPLASGQEFAEMLGCQAMLLGGDRPIMQRVGDFRVGKRSKAETFCDDLFDFQPTLADCAAGDISLAVPGKIMRNIWRSMKLLDTVVPGVLHPGTIMYYPEVKLYANKPSFIDDYFRAAEHIYLVGDGAGTSRGITAAWASGMRAADGILSS
ncbi:MAG: FAD-dependent oxidoreductase [Desulfobacteraceae bacterium]|nr:FAD-dependent oxidoreductase [Desulfobacteraceae bacterium]MBC2757542.1 FAD-dependent oxidoreductase [Desulfobacteraceae bacterium]